MERLTKHNADYGWYCDEGYCEIETVKDNTDGYPMDLSQGIAIDRLAAYEDLNRIPEELKAALDELERFNEAWIWQEPDESNHPESMCDTLEVLIKAGKINDWLAELARYRAIGPVDEVVRVVRCGECTEESRCEMHAFGRDRCGIGERREV